MLGTPCGRVALGLPTSMQMPTRPSTGCPPGAGPQDTILPHKICPPSSTSIHTRYFPSDLNAALATDVGSHTIISPRPRFAQA